MSYNEIALAQNARRKSTRRSLLLIPTVSHSSNNSPKVLVRRRSLGWPLRDRSPPPGPRKFSNLQLDSLCEPHKTQDSLNKYEPLESDLPPLNDQLPSKTSECPVLPQIDQPSSQVPESPHSNNLVQPCVSADQRTVVRSADELYDRYVEELTEWPKFLSDLEDLVNRPVQITAIASEAIDENPVLAPFSRYLNPESQNSLTDNPAALQQRIRKLYRSCVCSLISLNRRRKEQHLFLSGAKYDWEQWCTSERIKLMPATRNTYTFSEGGILSRLSSLATSTCSDQSST